MSTSTHSAVATPPAPPAPHSEPSPDLAPPPAPTVGGVLRGSVKWFNDQKGFGFILDAEDRDVFVHYAVIEGDGFKTLEEGEVVEYEVEDGPKGLRAIRVARTSH